MVDYGNIHFNCQKYERDVRVFEWQHGDPMPEFGPSVGVDTETELITGSVLFPRLVVLGVYDPAHGVCYIVKWDAAAEFMAWLCQCDVQQRYFNLGFDEGVLSNEDPENTPLLDALDQGRVRDMQIRIHLNCIQTDGYIDKRLHSLAGCALHFLGYQMDKGDGTENSARLSFRRDRELTDEQKRYLPFDCITTWLLGEVVEEPPTDERLGRSIEVTHTQGMVVLAHISANGLLVDPKVFDALEAQLIQDMDDAREQLVAYGFPDPYHKAGADKEFILGKLNTALSELAGREYRLQDFPPKGKLMWLFLQLCNFDGHDSRDPVLAQCLRDAMALEKTDMRKEPKKATEEFLEQFEAKSFADATRKLVFPAYIARALELVSQTEGPYSMEEISRQAGEFVDEHPIWMSPEAKVGPKKFFQDHARDVIRSHPGLELPTTPKSGEIKMTLKDAWRLEDADVHDPFLTAYNMFGHCRKYLATYLNREYIKEDGRMHPRFTSIVRTGRTSCTSPNSQNYPSHDHRYKPKNVFRAPPGMVMCATDFSFVESTGSREA